jgi:hypothetical protein
MWVGWCRMTQPAKQGFKDEQHKRLLLTMNNPEEHGLTLDGTIEALSSLPLVYWCLCEETGEEGTYHWHVYLVFRTTCRVGRVTKLFADKVHVDVPKGSSKDCRDYCMKTGRHADKADTSISFQEWGDLPDDGHASGDHVSEHYSRLLKWVDEGKSTEEIVRLDPTFAFHMDQIDDLRVKLRFERYRHENRPVEVSFVTGPTGCGKTRGIIDAHGIENVYRLTSYRGGRALFDGYKGQDVLVFEEYASQFTINEMLNYLDIYPLPNVPCRYHDVTACWTHVYITSNLALDDLYLGVQVEHPETWRAFLRRISFVVEYGSDGSKHVVNLHKHDDTGEA